MRWPAGRPAGSPRRRAPELRWLPHLCTARRHRLDFMTMEEGKLQQTYEIFDLAGLSFNLVSMSTVKFTQVRAAPRHPAPPPTP